jgi:hypothetical protein
MARPVADSRARRARGDTVRPAAFEEHRVDHPVFGTGDMVDKKCFIDRQGRNMTVAARTTAETKTCGHLS